MRHTACLLRPLMLLLAAAWLMLAAGCTAPASRGGERPIVLLVSLDGFHPDYLERGLTPALDALAADGVRARWMRPAYPTLTFPNHYTLVTGLRPDRHGVIANRMWDPELGGFRLHGQTGVDDGRWWDGGEPLWVTVRRAGLRSATMFWPGSEAEIRGLRPNAWFAYSRAPTPEQRVDQVLAWLAEPQQPQFVTLYFEQVDAAGHAYGPHSVELQRQVARLDTAIGRLVDGIAALGLEQRVDLLIVSDHGMAQVEHTAALDDRIDPAALQLVMAGEVIGINPLPGRTAEVEAALLGRQHGYACWRRDGLPERWRFGHHPRVPAIVCQADEGWYVSTRARLARGAPSPGAHGYDPELPSMRSLFIAHGPSFRRGAVVEPFDNVDVYPLMTRLLGIAPQPHDGDPSTGEAMLR